MRKPQYSGETVAIQMPDNRKLLEGTLQSRESAILFSLLKRTANVTCCRNIAER